MKWLVALGIGFIVLTGCGEKGKEVSKTLPEKSNTPAKETMSKDQEGFPDDPYAAMEAEREAIAQSIGGKVSITQPPGENTEVKVYSGSVVVIGKDSPNPTIILESNRGKFVLVGQKAPGLIDKEGKLITVMGKPTQGFITPPEYKDLPQLDVQGVTKMVVPH